jgi:hypothetical protein
MALHAPGRIPFGLTMPQNQQLGEMDICLR